MTFQSKTPQAETPSSQDGTPLAAHRNERIFRFDDGDETIVVRVTEHYRNEFTAIDHENYDYDSPVGHGDTQMSAIADLFSKIPAARSDREERDRMADKWDHNRKLRAETV